MFSNLRNDVIFRDSVQNTKNLLLTLGGAKISQNMTKVGFGIFLQIVINHSTSKHYTR